jgi:hypothetical protein
MLQYSSVYFHKFYFRGVTYSLLQQDDEVSQQPVIVAIVPPYGNNIAFRCNKSPLLQQNI